MTDPGFWPGRQVLLTGHAGFKGGWLGLWLERLGAQVTGLAADVRDAEAVRRAVRAAGPEVVLHLAGQALVPRALRDPVGTYAVNVMGTVHLLDAIRRDAPGCRAVVVVSSDRCYRPRDGGAPYREDHPLGGDDPYASSKACQELVTASYRDALLAGSGVRIATARSGNVIGGGDWAEDRLVPDLVRAAAAGRPLDVRCPGALRPWQHVLDPLAGYLALAERLCGANGDEVATAFNFGPAEGDARSVRWVVERLAERWPGGLEARYGASVAGGVVMSVDSGRARSALGWAPRWDLPASLDATADWYARHHEGEDPRALCIEQIDTYTRAPVVV